VTPSSLHYFPLPLLYVLILGLAIALLLVLLEIRVLSYAFETIGIQRRYVLLVLMACLIGSYINVPIAELPAEQIVSNQIVHFFGMDYVVPRVEVASRTIIAVNIGGAVIPILLSCYLIAKQGLWFRSLLASAVVAAVVHRAATPIPGVGIAVPVFIPALVAGVAALLLSRRFAPPLAYVSGSIGTLIGADLLNLDRLAGLGAPIASIGGAGTFDGIFLVGILAVLLAALPFGSSHHATTEARHPA